MTLPALVDQYGSPLVALEKAYQPSSADAGWYPLIREPFTGAWQRNVRVNQQSALSFHAVFACITLIASSISKLEVLLLQRDDDGIWSETESPRYSPVLRKPNGYQNRIQFWENWILSKLICGNTYVLKERDAGGAVRSLYILDPNRVRPMVANDGSIFYELDSDNLSGVSGKVMVPAREIIHDRMHGGLFHPLCGVSPIYAAGLAATQGLEIQQNSARFFGNNSQPGGILTGDRPIPEADARRMKEDWKQNYGGDNLGAVAVLGNGLKFQQLAMSAVDAQLLQQLQWSAEVVCGVYHVPSYMINVGPVPLNNNVQALELQFYSKCLQKLFEDAELCLDEGLGIGKGVGPAPYYRTRFDIDNLLRMDGLAQAEFVSKLVGGSIYSPNEGRAYFDKTPVKGGESPMAQHQYYSLAALDKRNNLPDPFESGTNVAPKPPAAAVAADPAPAAKEIDPEMVKLAAAGRAHLAALSLQKHLDRLTAA